MIKDLEKRREGVRRHYRENKAYYLARNARVRARKKAYLDRLKDSPCKDCGGSFPPHVMEFDHVQLKTHDISNLVDFGWKRIQAELPKVEVVCANCHNNRTWQRRQGKWSERP